MAELIRALKVRDIVLFNVVAIVGIRWISIAAATGPSSISLWLLALVLFFVPQAVAVIYLSKKYPIEGGVYEWAKVEFGDFHGFVAGWCYWANNLVYYPSLLISVAAIASFIVPGGSGLASNKIFIASVSLVVLWTAIGFNVVGVKIGKWVQNIGAIGTFGPIIVIAALAGIIVYLGKSQTHFSFANMLPTKLDYGTLSFWSSMCFALAGLELAAVMSGEIVDAARTIRKATYLSGVAVVLVYLVGTVSLLIGLPAKDVNLVTGLVQSIHKLEIETGVRYLTNISALLITLAGIGGAGAWLAGSARILFVTGIDNYLPSAFGKVHPTWKTPHVAIIFQGLIATAFLLMSFIGASTEQAYLVLVDATIIVYFIPYIYIFLAAIRIFRREARETPGSKSMLKIIVSSIGGVTTAAAIVLTLFPPEAGGNPLLFLIKSLGSSLAFVAVGVIIFWVAKRRKVAFS
ncbi:MAG: APC family permease [Bacteroidetes bacterium]|nr:APC family permease [Bacteroidota bacterium]MCL5267169.1 APC family permease [Bacteroidota bacterium]